MSNMCIQKEKSCNTADGHVMFYADYLCKDLLTCSGIIQTVTAISSLPELSLEATTRDAGDRMQ